MQRLDIHTVVTAYELNAWYFLFFFSSLNSDNFSPLDVALLKGHVEISKLLLFYGAIENPACKSSYIFPLEIVEFLRLLLLIEASCNFVNSWH